ncbi:hypothetical protein CAOG_04195 [Capsaspora owczarzaki ATCC 30864]|uniref:RING-type E3 ubiquitin transferase n=1 Tax=Capsaspora owczarzaki (strain ATCC 30864) TaxID=595528 RepID=A0A0D2UE53_CAPO3|nr:hypothetical protein CAOG_04195 [Capsaspora owczarzaki ATCC 30864]KJE93401.1 hypothetical protein CAOG_004195 [Capsaspora owczarzaki ATCC 30864]|eukprot:XP_004348020.2 hypothetical protein CAOG_04195 [Capsaspora owczarzaki ATCC 30864]
MDGAEPVVVPRPAASMGARPAAPPPNPPHRQHSSSAAEQDGEDICRVCRLEATPAMPLYHPCKCTGSIRHVHADCLQQWLEHAGTTRCELCGVRFSFRPVYASNAPAQLSTVELAYGTVVNAWNAGLKGGRYVLVLACWGGLVPYITGWVAEFMPSGSTGAHHIAFTIGIGGMLCLLMTGVVLSIISMREFLNSRPYLLNPELDDPPNAGEHQPEQRRRGRMERLRRAQQIVHGNGRAPAHAENARVAPPQPQPAAAAAEDNNANNDDAAAAPPADAPEDVQQQPLIRLRAVDLLPDEQDALQQAREAQQQAAAAAAAAAPQLDGNQQPAAAAAADDDDEMDWEDIDAEPANAQAAGDAANVAAIANELMQEQDDARLAAQLAVEEDERGMEQLEDLIGLRGNISQLVTNATVFTGCALVFICCFFVMPAYLGAGFLFVANRRMELDLLSSVIAVSPLLANLLVGWTLSISSEIVVLAIVLSIDSQSELSTRLVEVLVFLRAYLRVTLLTLTEILLFPLFTGWWLDLCTLSLFDKTLADRRAFFYAHPFVSSFYHWLFGMCMLFNFAEFVAIVHSIVRPGMLWFLRHPSDPNFRPIADMIQLSLFRHARRLCLSAASYGIQVFLVVWLPVQLSCWMFNWQEFLHQTASNATFVNSTASSSSEAWNLAELNATSNLHDALALDMPDHALAGPDMSLRKAMDMTLGIPIGLLFYISSFRLLRLLIDLDYVVEVSVDVWLEVVSSVLGLRAYFFGDNVAAMVANDPNAEPAAPQNAARENVQRPQAAEPQPPREQGPPLDLNQLVDGWLLGNNNNNNAQAANDDENELDAVDAQDDALDEADFEDDDDDENDEDENGVDNPAAAAAGGDDDGRPQNVPYTRPKFFAARVIVALGLLWLTFFLLYSFVISIIMGISQAVVQKFELRLPPMQVLEIGLTGVVCCALAIASAVRLAMWRSPMPILSLLSRGLAMLTAFVLLLSGIPMLTGLLSTYTTGFFFIKLVLSLMICLGHQQLPTALYHHLVATWAEIPAVARFSLRITWFLALLLAIPYVATHVLLLRVFGASLSTFALFDRLVYPVSTVLILALAFRQRLMKQARRYRERIHRQQYEVRRQLLNHDEVPRARAN